MSGRREGGTDGGKAQRCGEQVCMCVSDDEMTS